VTTPFGNLAPRLFGLLFGGPVKEVAQANREAEKTTTGHDGWGLIGLEINYEDPELFCSHCSSRIESAYAEPEA